MSLLGKAALVLSFDIAAEAIVEHDNWHSHEHFQERMSVPGFLRGSRWVALAGAPAYFVLYEVADLATLASPAYLERLNNPSPWNARMMQHYRGMNRGFCRVSSSFGLGLGQVGLLLRFSLGPGREADLRRWLGGEALPALPSRAGLSSAHLFEAAAKPEFTQEQVIRGKDAGVDWVVLVTGYDLPSIEALAGGIFSAAQLEGRGATAVASGIYQLRHSVSDREAALA
jgi:hypothetical protein